MNKNERSAGERNLLWLFLFLIVFINGFEAGGYQASLYTIGQTYDLSITNMGIFASVELLATMLAPIALGSLADRSNKIKFILILLIIQSVFAVSIFISNSPIFFIIGIFFLGLTTSALQFISIATLAEAYPVTGKKKIGYITSMYALGALVSPLFVNYYLNCGISWKALFIVLATGSIIATMGIFVSRRRAFEQTVDKTNNEEGERNFVFWGVVLLCVVMCIYVGFENGFAFFIDTMFTESLKSSKGKIALSLFWAVMIPSRILVGHFSKYARKILLGSVVLIPVVTIAMAFMPNVGVVMAFIVPLGFACGAIYPSVLNTLLSFSGNKKATATGMITVSTGVGGVVFTALTGIMAEAFGINNAMICLAAFFIFSLIAVLMLTKLEHK